MNLICPSCQRMLQVSEQFAGQVLKCEHCGAPYSVPVLPQSPVMVSSGSVSTPASSSGALRGQQSGTSAATEGSEDAYHLVPPPPGPYGPGTPSGPSSPERPSATSHTGTGSSGPYGPGSPAPMDGIPLPQPVAGYSRLYSIWIKPDFVKWIAPSALALEFILLFCSWVVPLARTTEPLTGWQTGFGSHNNVFGFMFVMVFLLSLAAAIASIVLPRLPPDRLHPRLREILPWRSALVFGLTASTFFFLALEMAMGFGADNEPALGTIWFRLGVLAAIVAVAGAGLEWWLTLRGPQLPWPRIDISW